jgi:uncharacterized protein with NAD-binding domain and iron-sulfur cluster
MLLVFAVMSTIQASPSPLRIAIVGAGLGGLAAAVSLRRQGHNVDVSRPLQFARGLVSSSKPTDL